MEAITPTRARSFGIPLRLLVRQPQLWAALAAFVGAALGLAGAFRLAAWLGDPHGSLHSLSLLALLVAPLGELLVALSLLGVLPLLGGAAGVAARAARILGVLLVYLFLLVFMATLAIELGWIQLGDDAATSGRPPSLLAALLVLGICLPPLVVGPFALAAFLSRRARLGAVLLGLCALAVPSLIVWQMVSGGIVGAIPSDAAPAVLLGGLGTGVSLLEAPL